MTEINHLHVGQVFAAAIGESFVHQEYGAGVEAQTVVVIEPSSQELQKHQNVGDALSPKNLPIIAVRGCEKFPKAFQKLIPA
mmetsp:Transcript_17606/g.29878  ORF Transcript_17606/g.29878 Transcript_17606/m.29878 type:complete len:82 (+) Transcript_17606:2353-2598(+)